MTVMYVVISGPDGLNWVEITSSDAQDCSGHGPSIDVS